MINNLPHWKEMEPSILVAIKIKNSIVAMKEFNKLIS